VITSEIGQIAYACGTDMLVVALQNHGLHIGEREREGGGISFLLEIKACTRKQERTSVGTTLHTGGECG